MAALAPSSGEEPTPPRYRADERAINLISTQAKAKDKKDKGDKKDKKSMFQQTNFKNNMQQMGVAEADRPTVPTPHVLCFGEIEFSSFYFLISCIEINNQLKYGK